MADRQAALRGHVILIEDVLTSGATIDACAQAAQVDVLVFARVVDTPKAPI